MATAGGGRDGGEEMDCWYADAQPLDATLYAIAEEYRGELEDASLEGVNTVEWGEESDEYDPQFDSDELGESDELDDYEYEWGPHRESARIVSPSDHAGSESDGEIASSQSGIATAGPQSSTATPEPQSGITAVAEPPSEPLLEPTMAKLLCPTHSGPCSCDTPAEHHRHEPRFDFMKFSYQAKSGMGCVNCGRAMFVRARTHGRGANPGRTCSERCRKSFAASLTQCARLVAAGKTREGDLATAFARLTEFSIEKGDGKPRFRYEVQIYDGPDSAVARFRISGPSSKAAHDAHAHIDDRLVGEGGAATISRDRPVHERGVSRSSDGRLTAPSVRAEVSCFRRFATKGGALADYNRIPECKYSLGFERPVHVGSAEGLVAWIDTVKTRLRQLELIPGYGGKHGRREKNTETGIGRRLFEEIIKEMGNQHGMFAVLSRIGKCHCFTAHCGWSATMTELESYIIIALGTQGGLQQEFVWTWDGGKYFGLNICRGDAGHYIYIIGFEPAIMTRNTALIRGGRVPKTLGALKLMCYQSGCSAEAVFFLPDVADVRAAIMPAAKYCREHKGGQSGNWLHYGDRPCVLCYCTTGKKAFYGSVDSINAVWCMNCAAMSNVVTEERTRRRNRSAPKAAKCDGCGRMIMENCMKRHAKFHCPGRSEVPAAAAAILETKRIQQNQQSKLVLRRRDARAKAGKEGTAVPEWAALRQSGPGEREHRAHHPPPPPPPRTDDPRRATAAKNRSELELPPVVGTGGTGGLLRWHCPTSGCIFTGTPNIIKRHLHFCCSVGGRVLPALSSLTVDEARAVWARYELCIQGYVCIKGEGKLASWWLCGINGCTYKAKKLKLVHRHLDVACGVGGRQPRKAMPTAWEMDEANAVMTHAGL